MPDFETSMTPDPDDPNMVRVVSTATVYASDEDWQALGRVAARAYDIQSATAIVPTLMVPPDVLAGVNFGPDARLFGFPIARGAELGLFIGADRA